MIREEQMERLLQYLEPNLAWEWRVRDNPPLVELATQIGRMADAIEGLADEMTNHRKE